MKKSSSKKKSADSLDDVFLDALKDKIPEELSAEEVLSEDQLDTLDTFLDEGEPEVERFPEEEKEKAVPRVARALNLVVSDDRMVASLLAENCRPYELEEIEEELQKGGVVSGIDPEALARAIELLQTAGGWQGELVVARGSLPALDDLISFSFFTRKKDPGGEKYVWMAGDVPLFFNEVKESLRSRSLDEIKKLDLRVKAVAPYEVLARLTGDVRSVQGYNVYGKPEGEVLTAPEPGENVEFDEADGAYSAEIFGYLVIDTKKISVLPPIWIPSSQMAVYYINYKQAGDFCFPYPENIQKLLTDIEVKSFSVMVSDIEKMSAFFKAGKELPCAIKIARGIKPIPGRDAEFEFYIDTEIRAGTLREDDSMDMRERNLVNSVTKDTLLGKKIKPTRGTPGKTVFGKEVKAPNGMDRIISTNEGVLEKKLEDGVIEYYAKIDGNVSYTNDYVAVTDSFGVEGDVDYTTGNIEVKTGLRVGGSVKPSFAIKAGGNTIINETVELGAQVFVDGDLMVGKGIVGEGTKVIVLGNLQVEFIQDAEVVVKGDITVGSYIYNGTVRAGGRITIKKAAGTKGGKTIGGFVCASQGIELSTVGSPTNKNTIVSIQADPVLLGKQQKLNKDREFCDTNIAKMLRTLDLKTLDPELIKAMLVKLPVEQREMVVKVIVTLNKFIKHRSETTAKRKQLGAYIEQCLKRAKIRVSSEFFEGNEVEIGEMRFVATNDIGPSIFQWREDRIVY